MAKYFLDWRHKVMMLWLAATSALTTVAGWMYDHELGRFISVPLFIAGLFSFMALVMDTRNQAILNEYYVLACAQAQRLGEPSGGPIALIPTTRGWKGRVRYRTALVFAYVGSGLFLCGFAVGFAGGALTS
jgi:hypothetical protein